MKKIQVMMIAFGMGLMVSFNAMAQGAAAPKKETAAQEQEQGINAQVNSEMKQLIPDIGLKGEQIPKMKEELHRNLENNNAIYDSKGTKEEKDKKRKAENERHIAAAKEFLTKEQLDKYIPWHPKKEAPAKKEAGK